MKLNCPKILEPKLREIMRNNPGIKPGAALIILYNMRKNTAQIKWKEI